MQCSIVHPPPNSASRWQADGKVLARTLDEERHSALHFAAARGKPELVKALVQAGAEVNLPDRAGGFLDGWLDPRRQ